MTPLNQPFKNLTFSKSVEPLSRHQDLDMTQNEHVYAMCCPPEVAGDFIYGRNIKTAESYVVANFEIASSSSFWDIKENHFMTADVAEAKTTVVSKHKIFLFYSLYMLINFAQ